MSFKWITTAIRGLVTLTLIAFLAFSVFIGSASASVPRGQCDLNYSGVYFKYINGGWKAIASGSAECSALYVEMRVILFKNGSVYAARTKQWSQSWDSQRYDLSVRKPDPAGRQKYRAVTRVRWVDQFGTTHTKRKASTAAYF